MKSTLHRAERAHDLIWSQLPERQNRASSSWWFFLLFPEGPDGYGPRQLMFAIAGRAGARVGISGVVMPGIDLQRAADANSDRFNAAAVGWYCDGVEMYEDYVKVAAVAELSQDSGTLHCLTASSITEHPGPSNGITIRRSEGRMLSMQTEVFGHSGRASFTTWGDLTAPHTSPDIAMDIDTAMGGVHYAAVRKLNFEGDFDLPGGREHLKGLGFFQRVAMNVPLFPWKWIYALFPDGSLFTAYVPYIGFNLTRRAYRFFSSNRREQAALPISQKAFYFPSGATIATQFNRVVVRPLLNSGSHPCFQVEARNSQGDSVSFFAATYGHARSYIDRPILGGLFASHWTYNEYAFRMEELRGRIGNREITHQTMGQGYGNLEYTWGLGL